MADDLARLPNIPNDVLQDLCSRFLINIPKNEKNDMVRICFQIELAHWYYIDFCRQDDPELPACGMKAFMAIIFSQFDFLNKSNETIQTIYENWRKYKVRVPVFGAILLDETLEKCLLVQPFHKKASWGFPKGKVNKDEGDLACAIREVQEEVGFDITQIAKADQFLENNIHDHQVRLYIVPGVPENYRFQPNTRGEIRDIHWFNIYHLPTHKKDPTPKDEIGLMANNFFMIHSFIRPLRKWVNEKKEQMNSFFFNDPIINLRAKPILPEERYKDEYARKLRYEEEAEKFKQMHINPLRANKSDEDALKSILGMKVQRDSPETCPQPEAIRKLLTGTLEISPKTTPEKSKSFKVGHANHKHNRSSPNNSRSSPKYNDHNGRRNPAQKLTYSNVAAKNIRPNSRSNAKESNGEYINISVQPFNKTVGFNRPYSGSPDLKEKLDLKDKVDLKDKLNIKEENSKNYVLFNRPYSVSPKLEVKLDFEEKNSKSYISNSKVEDEPSWRGLGDFYYSAPAFENFRFDYDKILAALN